MSLLPPAAAPTSISGVVNIFIGLINGAILLIAGLSVLFFFKGLAAVIWKAGDEKALAEGKRLMIWGVVSLFVMVCLWGIISLLYGTFGFQTVKTLGVPLLPQTKVTTVVTPP